MERTLEMTFGTSQNQKQRLRVYDAKSTLTAAEINTAMDTIINRNIIETSAGVLTSKIGARIITTDSTEIDLG